MKDFLFTKVSSKQWKQKIQYQLNGLEYNQELMFTTDYGVVIKPFYTAEDGTSFNRALKANHQNSSFEPRDILGQYLLEGKWSVSKQIDVANFLKQLSNERLAITIDTSIYQNLGATVVQQLAYGLAIAKSYVRFYGKDVVSKINFNFAIADDFFLELSKLKAIRYLWSWFLTHNQLAECATGVFTCLSKRNFPQGVDDKDLYTLAYVAATLGGADSFQGTYLDANSFVFDKGYSGSVYEQNTIHQLVEKAIEVYKLIEKGGGFLSQVNQGIVQRKIKKAAQKKSWSPSIVKNIRKTAIEALPKVVDRVFKVDEIVPSSFLFRYESTLTEDSHWLTEGAAAGFFPFLRGHDAMMYTKESWKIIEELPDDRILISSSVLGGPNEVLQDMFAALKAVLVKCIAANQAVDVVLEKVVFQFRLTGDFYQEIALLRSARVLWSYYLHHEFSGRFDELPLTIATINTTKDEFSGKVCSLLSILSGVQYLEISTSLNQLLTEYHFFTKTIDPMFGNSAIETYTASIVSSMLDKIC